ncbi:MAG: RsmE family RNA methyltransferase [Fibrobacterota bacterium]
MQQERCEEYLFFSNETTDEALVLDAFETEHLVKVLRFGVGDGISVTDGTGTVFRCRIDMIQRNATLCSVKESRHFERPRPRVTACIGIPEKSRLERACEMLPPLGIDRIVPFVGEQSAKGWWKKGWSKAARRFERVISSSIKQSFNPFRTELAEPITFSQCLHLHGQSGLVYADPRGGAFPAQTVREAGQFAFFVGPPEGFSPDEMNQLKNAGGIGVYLGAYRLRSETAAIALSALFSHGG